MDFNTNEIEIAAAAKVSSTYGLEIQVLGPAFGEHRSNRIGVGYANRNFEGLSDDKTNVARTGSNDFELIWDTRAQITDIFLYTASVAGGVTQFRSQVGPEFVKTKTTTLPYFEFRFGTGVLVQEKESSHYSISQFGVFIRDNWVRTGHPVVVKGALMKSLEPGVYIQFAFNI